VADDVLLNGTPDSLRRYAADVFPRFALLAAMQLEVFTQLKDGPMRPEDVASRLKVDPGRLRRLLYGLVRTGLVTIEGDRFANSPGADQYLVRGRPAYMGGAHEIWSDIWAAALNTATSIRTGVAQAAHDFSSMTRDELAAFLRGTQAGALRAGATLAKSLAFHDHKHLLDVGGGSAGFAIGACSVTPQLRATVIDLPSVTPITAAFVAEAGLSERIAVQPVDISKESPSGTFDVAVMRDLIQTMGPDQAESTCRRVGAVVPLEGRVHVVGYVLDDSRLGPSSALDLDVVFLNIYQDGAAFTESEYRSWLATAGFEDIRRSPAPAGSGTPGISLISARKGGPSQ